MIWAPIRLMSSDPTACRTASQTPSSNFHVFPDAFSVVSLHAGRPAIASGAPAPMAFAVQRPPLLVADRWRDYQLLDCGDGMKQERWGPYTLVRPDPQVLWPRRGMEPGARWEHWDGYYHRGEAGGGHWE